MTDDLREQIERLEQLVAGPACALAFPALAEAHRRAGQPEAAERVAREGLERAPHVSSGRVALALALLDQKRTDETRAELERLLGGETEHAIARDAAASGAPEGVGIATPDRGELATLEPYPEAAPLAIEPVPSGPFGPPPPPAPAEPLVFDADEVRDDELDDAFDQAETDREQMFGTDDMAEAALSSVPDDDEAELEPMARAEVADGEDELAQADGPGAPPAGSPFATETFAGLLEQQGHVEDAELLREQIATEPEKAGEPIATEPGLPQAAAETPGADGGPGSQATLERWLDNLRRDTR